MAFIYAVSLCARHHAKDFTYSSLEFYLQVPTSVHKSAGPVGCLISDSGIRLQASGSGYGLAFSHCRERTLLPRYLAGVGGAVHPSHVIFEHHVPLFPSIFSNIKYNHGTYLIELTLNEIM